MNTAVGLVETCNAVGVSLGPAIGGVLYEVRSSTCAMFSAGVTSWFTGTLSVPGGQRGQKSDDGD